MLPVSSASRAGSKYTPGSQRPGGNSWEGCALLIQDCSALLSMIANRVESLRQWSLKGES